MDENNLIEKFWQDFLDNTKQKNLKYDDVFSFGCGSEMETNLAKLVVEGKKRATTSLHEIYRLENEKIPEKNKLSIVLDGNGKPVAVIKNIEVKIIPFKDINEADVQIEGEGDSTLKFWRDAHINVFTKECEDYNIKFSEEMLVVFEIFEVIY